MTTHTSALKRACLLSAGALLWIGSAVAAPMRIAAPRMSTQGMSNIY